MEIDFKTGKVIYNRVLDTDEINELKESLAKMKIEEDAVFQKTRHHGLSYGRLKYLFYCFLLMMDGLIGIVSFGQIQSILANKYLLSKWITCEGEEHEHR